MTLAISPGPLPQNDSRVEASEFLPAFVSGTEIKNIGLSEICCNSLSFVLSQTDTPDTPFRGLFWFQRGKGQLWFYDDPDRGNSRYTDAKFVGVGPVREILVEVNRPSILGGVLSMNYSGYSSTAAQYYRDFYNRQTLRCTPDTRTPTGGSAQSRLSSFMFLAAESAPSGLDCRAVEWGFVSGWFGCGASMAAGAYAKAHDNQPIWGVYGDEEDYVLHSRLTAITGESGWRMIGIMAATGGTDVNFLATIYKRPTVDTFWFLT